MTHKISNAKRRAEDAIDVDLDHPDFGTIPYTAVNNSGEEEMQAIWDAIQAGEAGEIEDDLIDFDYEPVPETVSRFQAKAALMQAGLLEQVETAIATADPLTKLAWAETVEYQRRSPMVEQWGELLDLEPEQVDDLFRAAAKITV